MSLDYLNPKYPKLTEKQRAKRNRSNKIAIAGVAFFLLLSYLWSQGAFDQALWKVGLNHDPCAENGFGAVFCGDQLTQYNQRLKDAGLDK